MYHCIVYFMQGNLICLHRWVLTTRLYIILMIFDYVYVLTVYK